MTDLKDYVRLLVKRKYILIGIPLVAVVITYFLVRHLPDVYDSKARIATGIVDDSQALLNNNKKQESEINQQFNNLVQMIQLKRMIDQVSYQLILHDLTDKQPFRKQSALIKQLNASSKKHAIDVFTQKHNSLSELSLHDQDQHGMNEVLKSMGYEEMQLRSKLSVYRVNNSDYIDVQFESENPELSAFLANTLTKEFLSYYDSLKKASQSKAVNFLEQLMKEKYAAMNAKMLELKEYKIHNRVLNLNEEAKSVFGQIADFETRRQTAQKEITSYTAAIKEIDNKFKPQDRKYLEASMTNINTAILADKERLKQLNDLYVTSNFDEKYKRSIDSLRGELNAKITQSTDKYIFNPMSAKQDLISQKLGMEVALDLAKNSVASLEQEIVRLNQHFDRLVPHEAVIQAYENDIDVASREYLELLEKYNDANLASSFTVQPKQIEVAMPGTALPSKKIIMVILAGIVCFVFCLIVFFVLFYIDDSLHNARALAHKTDLPVLGWLPKMDGKMLDLEQMWQQNVSDKSVLTFKNLLRSSRFEIEKEMDGATMLAVTSMKQGEGKTFFAMSLAYACAMANSRVLLIDGNFSNNTITATAKPDLLLDDYLTAANDEYYTLMQSPQMVTVIGNAGNDNSLLEISNRDQVNNKLQRLRSQFDIIIVETPALENRNKAKEWMLFTDKTIAVFEAGQTINDAKKQYTNYFTSLNGHFIGWVINKTGAVLKSGKPAKIKKQQTKELA
ncbi:lipopolysaccharide biosynthesis protein [Ilyomonas limi]|uniref:Lipopolysaccharide biosynthesis protein n=1 Tax=Ilyomonas limi TaxID=2575867 RepID=A0A4V5UTJ4_9BACT|nr:AAA family ATPase [Ilyomonas limi]TKK65233.1 lipopolysaccharide biosynthesis protein [Ilyomonas limi]